MTTVVVGVYENAQKMRSLQRVIAMREKVYTQRVANGYMSQKEAEYEIDIMRAILKDYEP